MPERAKLVFNYGIGVIGTAIASLTSMSPEEWAHVAAIFAGFGTFLWMMVQCYIGLQQRACFRNDCHRRITTRK